MSDQLSIAERAILVGVALSVVAGAALSGMIGVAGWLVVLAAVGAGWRYVPGFWRTTVAGAVGGVAAGVVILGPGFRLAMRIVALTSSRPTIVPEFTIGGTLFIVILVGGVLGGMFGIGGALLRRGLGLSGLTASASMAVLLIGMLFLDGELRGEFMNLGASPWVNVPMFGSVAFLYALAANRIMDRIGWNKSRERSLVASGVQG
jgi:hypothetical protein